MLVLTRKQQEQIHIGDNIILTVVRVQGNTVRLGIEAPQDVRIVRGEIADQEVSPAQLPVGGERVELSVARDEVNVESGRPATGRPKSRPALRVRSKSEATPLNAV